MFMLMLVFILGIATVFPAWHFEGWLKKERLPPLLHVHMQA